MKCVYHLSGVPGPLGALARSGERENNELDHYDSYQYLYRVVVVVRKKMTLIIIRIMLGK